MLIELDKIRLNKPLVSGAKLIDYRLTSEQKKSLRNQLGAIGYGFDSYTSFAITDAESADRPANYALIPNQYFVFASEMYELAIELFKYFEIFEKLRPYGSSLLGNSDQIYSNINSNDLLRSFFVSNDDIKLFAKFLDKDDASYRFGSKRLVNDQGRPRGSRDCFGSVILKEINLPDASSSIFGQLVYDLCLNPKVYSSIHEAYTLAIKTPKTVYQNLHNSDLTIYKPFLLLAGISGTGKTRFVREQAKANGGNYQLVAVRPDWHEPSDLLGYVSRLGNNGPEYITTDVLKFLVKAWKVIADSGLSIETSNNKLQVVGKSDDLKALSPFWLCLDEMNLAPVEQYFADYLSILETREWLWDDTEFTYSSDALLSANIFTDFSGQGLRKSLEMDDSKYDDLWSHFCAVGMPIPFNLIVAGTVNMDETTHGFSRKVIDRALSFDFGEFFPNDFQQVFESKTKNKILSFPIYSHAQLANIRRSTVDPDGQLSIDFLESVNQVLKNTPFELAYRALNELLLSVVAFDPKDKAELQAVWDDFLMCKVLPRIDGDLDKLQGEDGILRKLTDTLALQLDEIWNEDKNRLDLYRISVNNDNEALAAESDQQNSDENKLSIKCRSKKKLKWMSGRLATAGFTSFWP